RGENACTLKVHLRLAELGFGLREGCLGAHMLRLQRFDLPLCKCEVCLGTLHAGLLLGQLRCELLGVLDSTRAGLREALVSGSLLLCEHERSLRYIELCLI